ncbi:Hsp70 family protein [Gordonia sp. CPCC 206044]|uniref:Hsp70 family protein n=1 Tax=Gordonia sp. CPCC 206044 TaxID=3140793 RepID=UPI003AF37396
MTPNPRDAGSWTLAIDFGTSNSAAAHSGATSGGIETLALSHASNLMPSSVFVAAPDRIVVGEAAINQAQQNPAGFVASPKRLIGPDPNSTVGGHTLPTFVLVAAVMNAILVRGKAAHAGRPPAQVVLTHPEAWAHQQIKVLFDAAVHAGIDPARITTISEPRAAAAHYSRSHAMQPGAKIAVFDFGGGTLDIAVLTVTNENVFGVVAARGNNGLGGKNLDALVQRWVEDRLEERDPQLVTYLRRQAPVDVVQSLQDSIRRAKELLSETPSATITVPTPAGRQTLQITRDEFEELIGPAVEQALSLTKATLLDAGIAHAEQLTALYLTGGSSRIPLIQQKLNELGPVATLDDPKTVVAQGALVTALAEAAPVTGGRAAVPGPDAGAGWPGQQAAVAAAAGLGAPTRPVGQSQSPADGRPATPRFADPAEPSAPKKPWGRIGIAVVAVVAIVGVVFGVMALRGGDEDTPVTPGGGGKPSAAAAADSATASGVQTDADGNKVYTDKAALLGALPESLQQSIATCQELGYTSSKAIELGCRLSEDSDLVDLGTSVFAMFTNIVGDQAEAGSEIINIRKGIYGNGKGTLVEDADRVAAADIIDASVDGKESHTIRYANTANGLVITVDGLKTVDDAKAFLNRSGLIS